MGEFIVCTYATISSDSHGQALYTRAEMRAYANRVSLYIAKFYLYRKSNVCLYETRLVCVERSFIGRKGVQGH